MILPPNTRRIVRAQVRAFQVRDGQRRQVPGRHKVTGCDGKGHKLRRSCAHARHVSCPLCRQPVTYRSLRPRLIEIDPHQRGGR